MYGSGQPYIYMHRKDNTRHELISMVTQEHSNCQPLLFLPPILCAAQKVQPCVVVSKKLLLA